MHTERSDQITGQAEVGLLIELRSVSKWYGKVIGLNDLTLEVRPGVTGLLGPNGAGKSTLLQLVTGQLRPSRGKVRVLGQAVGDNPTLNRQLGLCPEQDAFYEWMTGWQFVVQLARLSGLRAREAHDAAQSALQTVRMTKHMHRPIRGYSQGMRQRTKIAQAIVHRPQLLVLDEPLAGCDPVARAEIIDVITEWGRSGKSVLVSSHVLHEVGAMTRNIVLLNRGRIVAEGDIRQIRELIDTHPHRIALVCENYRALAVKLVAFDDVVGIHFLPRQRTVMVETQKPDTFYARLPAIALEDGTEIEEVYSDDDNLEAVFKYLVS